MEMDTGVRKEKPEKEKGYGEKGHCIKSSLRDHPVEDRRLRRLPLFLERAISLRL